MRKFAIAALAAVLSQETAQAATFETWEPWEVDSIVAAWALKRYVDSQAVFVVRAKGTPVTAVSSIDTPDSWYKRGARTTAFDEVIRRNHLVFPCLKNLVPIIRTLELSPWRKSADPASEAFEQGLVPMLPQGLGQASVDAAFAYIDAFCEKVAFEHD